MNWSKGIIAGLAGGVVKSIYEAVMYGGLWRSSMEAHSKLFNIETNPLWYTLVTLLLSLVAGLLFARTRSVWAAGFKGGATYGFWLGLIGFVAAFYQPLSYVGFPYVMTWYWGITDLVGMVIFGAVAGLVYKEATTV